MIIRSETPCTHMRVPCINIDSLSDIKGNPHVDKDTTLYVDIDFKRRQSMLQQLHFRNIVIFHASYIKVQLFYRVETPLF